MQGSSCKCKKRGIMIMTGFSILQEIIASGFLDFRLVDIISITLSSVGIILSAVSIVLVLRDSKKKAS